MLRVPNNCESDEFPYHSKYGDRYPYKVKVKEIKKSPIFFSNELPDIFRLSHMKEGTTINTYNNPFLSVDPIDREENNKDLKVTRKIIKYIDTIKSNPKINQNPLILRKIKDENFYKHKTNLFKSSSQKEFKPSMNIERIYPKEGTEKQKEDYQRTIFNLYKKYTKPIGFKLRNEIDHSNNFKMGNLEFSELDKDKVERLHCPLTPRESNWICNVNNYDIRDNYTPNKRCFFEFKRKPFEIYDPILNKHRVVQPDIIKVDKWDQNEEAFELLKNNLKRKGGIFSEFTMKNKSVFEMNKVLSDEKSW
ncbi:MAG: hypothetical protein MJ252_18350 [archaeon]|nr:hypothetical protein [archaeon]